MKFKNLIPLALMSIVFLTGYTRNEAQVQVGITLPSSGQYNYWDIQFYDSNNNLAYEFFTDDNTFNSGILGNVQPGTYEIDFRNVHVPDWYLFDYSIYNTDAEPVLKEGHPGFQFFGAVIQEGTNIVIDKE